MKEYRMISYLVAAVYLKRGFIERLEEEGLDAVLEDCGCKCNDLTAEQRATFEACFNDPDLLAHAKEWWVLYDTKREAKAIPSAAAESRGPWMP